MIEQKQVIERVMQSIDRHLGYCTIGCGTCGICGKTNTVGYVTSLVKWPQIICNECGVVLREISNSPMSQLFNQNGDD